LGLCALSAPAAERRELDTQVPASAAGQPMLSQLPATNRLRLAIGLPLHNQPALTNLLKELYDQRSPNFHRFLTPDLFTERFGPTEQDYQRVKDFAVSNHLEVVETFGNRAVLDVSGRVADIEDAFRIKLGYYQHPTEHRQYLAPDRPPTIEADLPVRYVSGLDTFVQPHSSLRQVERARPADQTNTLGNGFVGIGSGTNGYFLAADFRNAYVPGVTNRGDGQLVGLFELGGYTPSDITLYESLAGLPDVTLTNIFEGGLTANVAGTGNAEVALDIEMVIAMAPGLSKVAVVEASDNSVGITDAMNALASPGDTNLLASQISSSGPLLNPRIMIRN